MAVQDLDGNETVCLDFNANPRLTENNELILNPHEELTFQNFARSDNLEFGISGTVYLTTTRIAWISEDGRAIEVRIVDA